MYKKSINYRCFAGNNLNLQSLQSTCPDCHLVKEKLSGNPISSLST